MLKHNSFVLITIFLCIWKTNICTGEDEVPLVRVKQGLIRGIADKSLNGREFYSYMSIPYAEPPVGKLRFKDPVPLESWDDVLDGTKMPTSCLQQSLFNLPYTVTLAGKEDCLHLNVFTDSPNEKEKKLPVMVFIHGGAFIGGSAAEYQPYVLMNKEIVLVVIQYRLGIFGFLSTEDSVMPGNMGLKDQQLALKWIKENIEAFGGDSNRITIFGESAGGGSVHYQVLSPGSKGLFNRAIIQSGTSLCPWASNKNHRKFAIETGQRFNCSFDLGTEVYLECMQNVDPYYLTIAASSTNILGLAPIYVLPRVDGEFIDEAPEILMKKGKYNKVDIVQGVTRDEGGLDLLFEYVIPNRREMINKNFEKLGPLTLQFEYEENPLDLTKQVYRHYLNREDVTTSKEDWREIVDMNTDRMFKVCHDIVAHYFAKDSAIKLYTYELDHKAQSSFMNMIPGLADLDIISHGEDLSYLFFGGQFLSTKHEHEDDVKMQQIFVDLWTNFAQFGNPTPPGFDFKWNEATINKFHHLSLTPSPAMKEDGFQKKREFWFSLKTSQNLLLQSYTKK